MKRSTVSKIALVIVVLGLLSLFGCRGQAVPMAQVESDTAVIELVAGPDGTGEWVEVSTSDGDTWRFVAVFPTATQVPPTETMLPPTDTPTAIPTDTPTPTQPSPIDTPTPEPPTATSTPTETPIPTDTPIPTPTDTPTPTDGVLFGPFNWIPGDDWPFTLSRVSVTFLPVARDQNVPVLVAVAGKSSYTTGGCFDLVKYQNMLDDYLPRIAPYVGNTVIGLYAIDEPHDWPGCGPSGADLDAICRHVHQDVPGLACGFNTMPSWLIERRATQFDFWFTQTNWGRLHSGREWATWAAGQIATAKAYKDIPIYLSQNAVTFSPTAAQIRDAAIALCESGADGSLFWAWTARDFTGMRSELVEAAVACAEVE